ncbi:hypothetical protein COV13_02330 [Candidatus Woesearchaeota archaeon CG10_big_fil_rev_8_21_14_0_10_32_9]|nr:MAG: hypothetical protein COV13_02330 [Candidatus Woesearchaeota archaeon CG10_big_fil_rev_8_21_14_0_10_32_9]
MVNITKLRLTQLQTEILRALFITNGSTINQRQLALRLNVTQPAIKKALPSLKKINFIKIQKDQRLSITLNAENHRVMQLKRIDNLKQIYESGFIDFLENEYAGATIILFGSYSRGEDTINSDIDLAIIGREEKKLDLKIFEKKLERKININIYQAFNKINKYLKENLANGILLIGGFEL